MCFITLSKLYYLENRGDFFAMQQGVGHGLQCFDYQGFGGRRTRLISQWRIEKGQ